MTRHRTRPRSLTVLLGLLLFLGVTALLAGFGLFSGMLAPPLPWLDGSPFTNYAIPGAALFVVLGVAPVVVATGVYHGRRWGWPGAVAAGLALLGWVAVQSLAIGWGNALQWSYLGVGVAIVALALVPSVRRHGRGPTRGGARGDARDAA